MSNYTVDPLVDKYILSLPDWQQTICQEVREIVHRADKDVEETIKRSVLPYFVLDGNICAFMSAKTHLNIFIYDPSVPDPHGIINQGHNNRTAQSIQVHEGETINEKALLEMFKAIIARNRQGGWRALAKA